MTWTAEIVSKEKKDGMVRVTARFNSDNGDSPVTQIHFGDNLDADALNAWLFVKLASLNACDAAFASLAAVQIGPITPTKPADKGPMVP